MLSLLLHRLQSFFPLFILGGFSFLYLSTAPHTVQTLDTGELVANSYLFRISHPPGYPLFTWIYGLITNIPFHESVFFRASFFTILLALISLFFLFKNNWKAFFSLLLLLGTSKIFWQYAILPDVFMLHIAIISAILYFYIKTPVDKANFKDDFIIVTLFALGAANHQTIIFLSPILVHVLIRNKFHIKILAPLILTFLLYLSLLFLDFEHAINFFSAKKNVISIFNYALRKNYGTFYLVKGEYNNFFLSHMIFFLNKWKFLLLGVLLYLADFKTNRKIKLDKRHVMIISSFLLYIVVFFNLANAHPSLIFNEIIERFTLTPIILLLGLVFSIKMQGIQNKYLSTIVIFISISLSIVNITENYKIINFSENTTIEDWAKARLESIKTKNTILFSISDSIYSVYYIQNVLGVKKEIYITNINILGEGIYQERIKNKIMNLDTSVGKIAVDFFKKNINNFSFNVDYLFRNSKDFKVTVHEIGRTISAGKGIHFSPPIKENRKIKIFNDRELNQTDFLASRFCHYYLEKGKYFYEIGKKKDSLKNFKKAIEVVHFCYPAYKLICKHFKDERKKYCSLAIDNVKYRLYFER